MNKAENKAFRDAQRHQRRIADIQDSQDAERRREHQ
jgi:hypothetical protein